MTPVRHPHHQRICFVAGPGTGKSTLAQALVVSLKMDALDVEYCPEFARAYLRRSGPIATPFEQFVIFAGACEREDELSIHQLVVCDSASFLSEVWFRYMVYHQRDGSYSAEESIKLERGLHELSRMCRARLKKFDHIFFIPDGQFAVPEDPTRYYLDQKLVSRNITAYLDMNDIDYYSVKEQDLTKRVNEVKKVLQGRGALSHRVGTVSS